MQVCRTSPPLALFLLEEVEGQSRKKKKLGDEGGDGEQLMAAQHDAAAGHCTHCGVREASHPSLAHSLANLPRSLLLPRPVTFAELGTEPIAREEEEEEEGGGITMPASPSNEPPPPSIALGQCQEEKLLIDRRRGQSVVRPLGEKSAFPAFIRTLPGNSGLSLL